MALTNVNRLLILAAFVMAARGASRGAELRLLVIASRTARPVPGTAINAAVIGGRGIRYDLPSRAFTIETGPTGIARFSIDAETEPRVAFGYPGECSPNMPFNVSAIIQTGIIGKNQCWHSSSKLKDLVPKPGEILLLKDQESFWHILKRWPDDFP